MLTIQDIVDAVNRIVVGAFPDRTVYRDVLPEQFSRPSFYIAAVTREVTSETVHTVSVTQSVLVQCIDETSDRYETEANRLYHVAEQLQNLFLMRGRLAAGDRRLSIAKVALSRVLDVADLVLTVSYEDDRPDDTPAAPIAGNVTVTPKSREKE